VRPRVLGKFDETGEWALPHRDWLLPAASELTPAMIARAIASRISRIYTSDKIKARLAFLEAKELALATPRVMVEHIPHFCSGCPHNTSTKVPEGSRVLAGIGCHYMATWLHADTTQTFSQMGGRAPPGSARRRSPRISTCSPTWATAPISTRESGDPRRGGGQGADHLQDPL
jgi:indolepyruvate ferredoxin oxidoreductase